MDPNEKVYLVKVGLNFFGIIHYIFEKLKNKNKIQRCSFLKKKIWFHKLETLQPNIYCLAKEIKCTFSNRTEDYKTKNENETSIDHSSTGKSEYEFDNQDFRQEKDNDMPIYKVVLVYPHGNFTVFSNTPIIGAQVDSELPMSFLKKLKNSKECSKGG